MWRLSVQNFYMSNLSNSAASDSGGYFTTTNLINISIFILFAAPLFLQVILIRKILYGNKTYIEKKFIFADIKVVKLSQIFHYIIAALITLIMLIIALILNEFLVKDPLILKSNRASYIILISIIFTLNVIVLLICTIKYKKIKVNTKIDWEKVKKYCLENELRFKSGEFQYRFKDSFTNKYHEENSVNIEKEWSKDLSRNSTFTKTKNIPVKMMRWYISKVDKFFFKQELNLDDKLHLICSIVINQLVADGICESIEKSIEKVSSIVK
ncbi:Hypothetical protein, predicted transmembrane protein [Mycoplasmopsis bovigenitalium 51080]|uniref:Uncharacterized protein n=1 Tax=Mycoplasmopsis bovigenitalium 51080 TaxID=1188235 RepID=N9TVQ8_9BACT|nr:hypothetical protein [Mycoplasmopsis bovigenitalium]ENY70194.1 Hypothetical protein, predicted transmembrane protein [Mycoplasmopsis bovigenitalium 51080]